MLCCNYNFWTSIIAGGENMMEQPSQYDFFLRFKAVFNNNGRFVDYILMNTSENFYKATNLNIEFILGKKISEIVADFEKDVLGIKDIFYNMIPKTIRRFEKRIDEFDRWYLINIFSDEKDYLIVFYSDISKIKNQLESVIFNCTRNFGVVLNSQKRNRQAGYKDKLTGLYNREFLEEELSRLDSNRQLPMSLIMGDLNGLKLINDAFGHDIGDKALQRVAELMNSTFRKEDIVSRMGGDEFVVLLPKTTEKTAAAIVERLKMVSDANPLNFIKISISFGVATKTLEEESISDIFRKAEERMYFNKLKESKEAKLSMIKYLKDKLEEVSFETQLHYERLKNLCLGLGNKIGLSDKEKEELKFLCEFHDIGKIGVPPYIWQKKESLSKDEWDKIRRHSQIGYYIIGASKEKLAIDELVLVHHERWDGRGYPGILEKNRIPVLARIFAIADAYEAMVNDRPYRGRISNKEALKEIEDKAGTQFDPSLAKTFVQMMTTVDEAI